MIISKVRQLGYTLSQDILASHFALLLDIHKYLRGQKKYEKLPRFLGWNASVSLIIKFQYPAKNVMFTAILYCSKPALLRWKIVRGISGEFRMEKKM